MRKIKKGDKVIVISGDFKGGIFKIEKVKDDKVFGLVEVEKKIVDPESGEEKIVKIKNIAKKAKKGTANKGEFIEIKLPIHISNVMLYCDNCKKGVKVKIEEKDGKKVRICKKCGKQF